MTFEEQHKKVMEWELAKLNLIKQIESIKDSPNRNQELKSLLENAIHACKTMDDVTDLTSSLQDTICVDYVDGGYDNACDDDEENNYVMYAVLSFGFDRYDKVLDVRCYWGDCDRKLGYFDVKLY